MKRWAITIGINQYHFLQPLSYAQQDAFELRNFLIQEAQFAPEQCLLLSDSSVPIWGQSTVPNRETIQGWIDLLCRKYIEPGDLIWFFFSGYGVCQQGKDYLVPIDGNPADLARTALPLEFIYHYIQATAAANVLVLLDMSRSQSSLPNETIGAQTVQLAGYLKIPTILSCQPGQFTHETAELQHGFFTAALLEELRYQRHPTLAGLHQQLSRRLPELSQHFWRPVQQPLIVSPPDRLYQVVLPQVEGVSPSWAGTSWAGAMGGNFSASSWMGQSPVSVTAPQTESIATATSSVFDYHPFAQQFPPQQFAGYGVNNPSNHVAAQGEHQTAPVTGYDNPNGSGTRGTTGTVSTAFPPPPPPSYPPPNRATDYTNGQGNYQHPSDKPLSPQPKQPGTPTAEPTPSESSDGEAVTELDVSGFRSPLLWGSLVAATLLLGVLGRNWSAIVPGAVPLSTATINSPSVSTSTKTQPPTTQPPTQPPQTNAPPSGNTTQPAVPASGFSTKPAANGGQAPSTTVSGNAQPNGSNDLTANPSVPAPNKTNQPITANGRTVLTASRSRVLIQSDQASPFWFAIQEAKQVPSNSPDYAAAQQDIVNWSQNIWTIATRRANQRSFETAIMAAALIPQEQATYANAQRTLPRWCTAMNRQSVKNRVQRRQARSICQRF